MKTINLMFNLFLRSLNHNLISLCSLLTKKRSWKHLGLVTLLILILNLSPLSADFYFITSNGSDTEERISDGDMDSGSSDLEMAWDGHLQYVGMRFNAVNIPIGAVITNAKIRFRADHTDSTTTSLIITGELSNDASSFGSGDYELSNRTNTVSSVNWSPEAWTNNTYYETVDISSIIQEIINQAGYAGDDLVIFIKPGSTCTDSDCYRRADSYNASSSNAPRLEITYTLSQVPPIMSAIADQSATKDSTFNFEISPFTTQTNGDPIINYTLVGTLATGLNFDIATGVISGIPTVNGTYNLSASATDNDGESNYQDFTITVSEALVCQNYDNGNSTTYIDLEDVDQQSVIDDIHVAGDIVANMNNISSNTTACIYGNSQNNNYDYYYFKVLVDGRLNIETSSPNSHVFGLKITTDNGFTYGTQTEQSHDIQTIGMHAGDTIYFRIKETGSNTDKYELTFNFEVGGNIAGDRDFTIRNPPNTRNITGNYVIGGSMNLCEEGNSGECRTDNGNSNSNDDIYIDIDNDSATKNSSSFDLNIPSGSTVIWAGLYWQGVIHRSRNDDGGNDFMGGTIPSNAPLLGGSTNQIDLTNNTYDANIVKLKLPEAVAYLDISADQLDYSKLGYGAFADITNELNVTSPNGTYTLADLKCHEGAEPNHGNYGAWSLVIIYQNDDEEFRNVSLFDGFATVDSSYSKDLLIDGFLTPSITPIQSKIAFFTMDGEGGSGGTLTVVSDSKGSNKVEALPDNPADSLFNSTITGVNNRLPNVPSLRFDLDIINLEDYLGPLETSTVLQPRSDGDRYTASFFIMSSPLYEPRVCYYIDTIVDTNGTNIFENKAFIADIEANKEYTYNLWFSNMKQNEDDASLETAKLVQIYTSMTDLVYTTDSSTVKNINKSSFTQLTDTNDTDIGIFLLDTNTSNLNIGAGSSFNAGGTLVPASNFDDNDSKVYFSFKGKIIISDENASSIDLLNYLDFKASFETDTLTIDPDNAQTIVQCIDLNSSGGIGAYDPPTTLDVIDTFRYASYITDKNISTKVVKKSFELELIHLDEDGDEVAYDGSYGNNKTLPMAIFMYLSNQDCLVNDELIWSGELDDGLSHKTIYINDSISGNDQGYTITKASKLKRTRTLIIDYGNFLDNASNLNCANSSLQSSLCLLPSCLNSDIEKAFPRAIYPHIATCVDGDETGDYAPCDSNAYTGSCGVKKGIIGPLKYDNDLGCAMCVADALDNYTCSSDDFAIRPEKFEITSTDSHMPDLLRAGSEYNLAINAYDNASSTNTQDYNQSSIYIDVNSTKWLNTSPIKTLNATTSTLPYTGEPHLDDFNISDGLSSSNGANGEVVIFSYADIGFITLNIIDKNWAEIDIDDTAQDCTADGSYICGEQNLTLIPHHFGFSDINITNHDGLPGNFTYIANLDDINQSTFSMSGRIQVSVLAQNESNTTTLNFDSGADFYEHPIGITSSISHTGHGDANTTFVDSALLGGFTNGVKTLSWNDTNLSQVLRFNFQRAVNNSLNPFVVNPSDVNLSVLSTYTGTAPSSPDNISGIENGLGDGSSTFVYGRTNIPRSRFQVNTNREAFIYYEVFCDGTDTSGTTCSKVLLNGIASNYTNDPRWFINTLHTTLAGSAGSVNQKSFTVGFGSVKEDTVGSHLNSVFISYDGLKGNPYKTTMENNASSWLIYNKYNDADTKNEFEVEFIGAIGDWAGKQENTTTTNPNNATEKVNRRSMW